MKACGNPKAYMGMAVGVILMVITVYLTIALARYMVRVEDEYGTHIPETIQSAKTQLAHIF